MSAKIALNLSALALFRKLCNEAEKYNVAVEVTGSGATLVDAGINVNGGFLAGEIITEVCLGGYGRAKFCPQFLF
jgi:methenyltetrahydromethanopterin cyclohydrolase